jgi:hypothetical protein
MAHNVKVLARVGDLKTSRPNCCQIEKLIITNAWRFPSAEIKDDMKTNDELTMSAATLANTMLSASASSSDEDQVSTDEGKINTESIIIFCNGYRIYFCASKSAEKEVQKGFNPLGFCPEM